MPEYFPPLPDYEEVLDTPVLYTALLTLTMLSSCMRGHVVLGGLSSYGACHLMGHAVLWGMSSYGTCHLMGHVVLWGMSSYGE